MSNAYYYSYSYSYSYSFNFSYRYGLSSSVSYYLPGCLLLTVHCLLLTTYCLRLTTYYLLLAATLLLSTYYLLLVALVTIRYLILDTRGNWLLLTSHHTLLNTCPSTQTAVRLSLTAHYWLPPHYWLPSLSATFTTGYLHYPLSLTFTTGYLHYLLPSLPPTTCDGAGRRVRGLGGTLCVGIPSGSKLCSVVSTRADETLS